MFLNCDTFADRRPTDRQNAGWPLMESLLVDGTNRKIFETRWGNGVSCDVADNVG